MKTENIVKFVSSIAICQLAGVIGSVFTSPSIPAWYAALQKPSFNPPDWVFAPVWILLFTLMGISLFLVLKRGLKGKRIKDKRVKTGLSFFGFQLVLNVGWSFLFFGLHKPFYAFLEIIVLWFAILFTIFNFWKVDKKAAYLLIPYLLWVSFAITLNFYIWRMNI